MKKGIALLLAVLAAFSCFALVASAADGDAPQTSASGFYKGQILKPGDEIKSAYETCSTFIITYSVDKDLKDDVTSEWQKKFCDEAFTGIVRFRDSIMSFNENEEYMGVYTVKGQGDVVSEMETSQNNFKNALEIVSSIKEEDRKAMRLPKEFDLTIDYDYVHTTRNQYTTITGWEVINLPTQDNEDTLKLDVRAVFETREPTKYEAFQEENYARWLKFLDKLGDVLLKIVPKIIAFWARVLGKNR